MNTNEENRTTMSNRRRFLANTCALGLSTAACAQTSLSGKVFAGSNVPPVENPIAIFAKHVQRLEFEELGRRLKTIGCQGIEATLRKGGQIEPTEMPSRLGQLVDALGKHDQRVLIAASDVNEANGAGESYVKQLEKHSIPYLRMAYYKYDFSRPILPQLESYAKKARELAALCAAHNVVALYQNHAGKAYVGAALWDLSQMLQEVESDGIAVAIDIRHTTLELTQSYQSGYLAIRSRVGATYVKDYDWDEDGKAKNVPLGQGRAKPFFDIIKKDGFVGPLSLHMEYTDHRDPSVVEESWRAIASDTKTLKKWLAKA